MLGNYYHFAHPAIPRCTPPSVRSGPWAVHLCPPDRTSVPPWPYICDLSAYFSRSTTVLAKRPPLHFTPQVTRGSNGTTLGPHGLLSFFSCAAFYGKVCCILARCRCFPPRPTRPTAVPPEGPPIPEWKFPGNPLFGVQGRSLDALGWPGIPS